MGKIKNLVIELGYEGAKKYLQEIREEIKSKKGVKNGNQSG